MKVQVGIDRVAYKEKPTREIPIIRKRVMSGWTTMDIAALADLVGNEGHAFVPGHLIGGISESNCVGMQTFVLDFDDGISFVKIQERCNYYNLPIALAYHTYSSTEDGERFRVVFVHKTYIDDVFVIKTVIGMFHKIFPECDSSCKNLDRMFLGGKGLIYLNENAHVALVQILNSFNEVMNVGGNYKRKIETFCRNSNIVLFNGRAVMGDKNLLATFDENDDFMENTIIHLIGESTESSFFVLESDGLHKSIKRKRKLRRLNISSRGACQLLCDFSEGVELHHDEKFAILTNLLNVNGGEKFFLDILERYYDGETYEKWKKDIFYMSGYHPQRCSSDFCPYYESCNQIGTILETLSNDRKIYRTEDTYYPLDEAVECLRKALEDAYASVDKGVHLIKAQTSIGKTTQYINLIREHPESRFIVAVPTNKLKRQVTEDLLAAGIAKDELFMTLSVSDNPFFLDIKEEIMGAHKRGIHNKTSQVLRAFYNEIKNKPGMRAVAEDCKMLLEGVKAIGNQQVVVTTHAYFMQMPEDFLKQFIILIDEDILQLQVFNQINTVSERCLNSLMVQGTKGYSDIARKILGCKDNEYVRISQHSELHPLSEEQLEVIGCLSDDNINDLQYAEAFVRKECPYTGMKLIKYFCPHKFPKLKYIVLSATLNEEIYRKYFSDSIPVISYTTKSVAYKGKVVQYSYHSLGRRDLSQKMQVFDFVRELAKNTELEIITFKEGVSINGVSRMNTQNLNFGNTTGINSLSGQDIGIVGTPYKVEEGYKLIACYLGSEVNSKEDEHPRLRRVDYKNTNFVIVTYKEPLLREIQLYALESELEQCVGRARLLRNDCTAYVLSTFPCEQAEFHMENYLL